MNRTLQTAMLTAAALLLALPSFADTFTSSSAFASATAGMTTTTANFDADTPGDIAEGATVDGITFNYTIDGGAGSLAIANLFDTTSPSNYLGSDDPTTEALFPGDSVTMKFASPVNALGFFIIGGPYTAGDFTLTDGTDNAVSGTTLEQVLGDGGQVIFLGITNTAGFSSATISLDSSAGELWDVDDIVTGVNGNNNGGNPTVPEPGVFTLLLVALGLLSAATLFPNAPLRAGARS